MPRHQSVLAARTTLLVLLAAVVILGSWQPTRVMAAMLPASCAPNSGSATISGNVTLAGGGPANLVEVTAYTTYGVYAGVDYTDASGNYQITGLIAGSYLLRFSPRSGDHAEEWYNDQPSALTATPVTVADGGSVTGIDVELALGARFSGQVTAEGGGPLQSIEVVVYDSDGRQVARATTDASGNYTTRPGLPSGSYRIEFRSGSGYLGSFYNGKPSLAEAEPLVATAPTVVSGVNAVLARGGEIRGTVTDATTGLPLSGIYVSASGENGFDAGLTDSSGNYVLRGLGSGSYQVWARTLLDSVNLVEQERTVTVSAPSATTGVDFAMSPGGTITGRVTGPGGTPLDGIAVFISNQDGSYQKYAYTNASGVYQATGMPSGEYTVFFRPADYIPERYNDRPADEQGDPITVTAPETVANIDAQLARGGGIRGKVTDATTGQPLEGVGVSILDMNGNVVESKYTAADGTYEIAGILPSGSYLVHFSSYSYNASCAYISAYYGGAQTLEEATPVNVTAPNVTPNVDAQLKRGSIIFGRVTEAGTGAPITKGTVIVRNAQGVVVTTGWLTFLGGYHTGSALPSGSYTVQFTDGDGGYVDEFYDDKPTLATATPVVVTAPNDVTGIDAELVKGGIISGRATDAATGAPFTNGYVIVYDASGNEVGYGSIKSDGSYNVLDGLATGSYYVAVIPYSLLPGQVAGVASVASISAVLDSATYGQMATFYGGSFGPGGSTPVAVTAGDTTSGIDIAVRRGVALPLASR